MFLVRHINTAHTHVMTHVSSFSLCSPISAERICLWLDCCNVTRASLASDNKSLRCVLFWEEVTRLRPPDRAYSWIVFKCCSWNAKIACSQIRICNSWQSIIWIKKESTADVYACVLFISFVTIATALSVHASRAVGLSIIWAMSCCLLCTVSLFTEHHFYLPVWSL